MPAPESARRDAAYKKTLDKDEARRGREETTISLRKDKRAEQLQKKRFGAAGALAQMPAQEQAQPVGSQAWQEANPQALVEGVNSNDPSAQLPAVTQLRKYVPNHRWKGGAAWATQPIVA